MSMFVDAHVHYHELGRSYKDVIILAVSDDLESSRKTLSLAGEMVLPCAGIHPWCVENSSLRDLEELERMLKRGKIVCLGEIGLDGRRRNSYSRQIEFFTEQLRMAADFSLPVNLHTLDAWREVLDMLDRYEIEGAIFHWFTGPLDLLGELRSRGYFITINPAVMIQEKHMRVLVEAPLDMILTESDGPYVYRGIRLDPSMIPALVSVISKVKGISTEDLKLRLIENLSRFLGRAITP